MRRNVAPGELEAWGGEPVFAYGFEDLTGAEWALLQALAGRSDVTVSMPYKPNRPAFASLRRTMDDLSGLADGRHRGAAAAFADVAEPALAHLERTLFAETVSEKPELEGAIRFFESAGKRGALELVGEELLSLLRSSVAAEQIGIVCPSLERWQAPLETALGTLGVPYALEGHTRLDKTPYGQALLSLLGFVARRRPRRSLHVPPLALLEPHATERRLSRGSSARPCGRFTGAS